MRSILQVVAVAVAMVLVASCATTEPAVNDPARAISSDAVPAASDASTSVEASPTEVTTPMSEVDVLRAAERGSSPTLKASAMSALEARRKDHADRFDPSFRLKPFRLKGRMAGQSLVLTVTHVDGFTFRGTMEWLFEGCTSAIHGVWVGNEMLFTDPRLVDGECEDYTFDEVKLGFLSRNDDDGLRLDGWDGPSRYPIRVVEHFDEGGAH